MYSPIHTRNPQADPYPRPTGGTSSLAHMSPRRQYRSVFGSRSITICTFKEFKDTYLMIFNVLSAGTMGFAAQYITQFGHPINSSSGERRTMEFFQSTKKSWYSQHWSTNKHQCRFIASTLSDNPKPGIKTSKAQVCLSPCFGSPAGPIVFAKTLVTSALNARFTWRLRCP